MNLKISNDELISLTVLLAVIFVVNVLVKCVGGM